MSTVAPILEGLNEQQQCAVCSPSPVLQVLAPPGSGKTKTLTARVAYLIAHYGIKPYNMSVCTFTVKAAREMTERIRSFVGENIQRQLKLGTFHGIARLYLSKYGNLIGLRKGFSIADTSDSTAILKRTELQRRFMTVTIQTLALRQRTTGTCGMATSLKAVLGTKTLTETPVAPLPTLMPWRPRRQIPWQFLRSRHLCKGSASNPRGQT